MQPETVRKIGLVGLLLAVVVAWCAVIIVALQVSQVVLDTLEMIVELAAISP